MRHPRDDAHRQHPDTNMIYAGKTVIIIAEAPTSEQISQILRILGVSGQTRTLPQ